MAGGYVIVNSKTGRTMGKALDNRQQAKRLAARFSEKAGGVWMDVTTARATFGRKNPLPNPRHNWVKRGNKWEALTESGAVTAYIKPSIKYPGEYELWAWCDQWGFFDYTKKRGGKFAFIESFRTLEAAKAAN